MGLSPRLLWQRSSDRARRFDDWGLESRDEHPGWACRLYSDPRGPTPDQHRCGKPGVRCRRQPRAHDPRAQVINPLSDWDYLSLSSKEAAYAAKYALPILELPNFR